MRMTTRYLLLAIGVLLIIGVVGEVLHAVRSTYRLAAARPMPNVLVYAKPVGPQPTTKPQPIWVATADGSHPRFLANGNVPSVSPDGRYVAYDSDKDVLVIPTAGGEAVTVSTHAGVPSWAPNSRFLAYYGAAGVVVGSGEVLTR